jgi:hypothetical protein
MDHLKVRDLQIYCVLTLSIRKIPYAFLADTAVNGWLHADVLKENTIVARNKGEEIHADMETFCRSNFVFTARYRARCIH